jgi:hypothetical protein
MNQLWERELTIRDHLTFLSHLWQVKIIGSEVILIHYRCYINKN